MTEYASTRRARSSPWFLSGRYGSAQPWVAKAHLNDVAAMTFLNNGAQLLTAAGGHRPKAMLGPSLRLWNGASGQLLFDFNGYNQRISALVPAGDADPYVVAQRGQPGINLKSSLLRTQTALGALEVVCDQLPLEMNRVAASAYGRVALGAPVSGTGPVLWRKFPDCTALQSRGFPAAFEETAGPILRSDTGAIVSGPEAVCSVQRGARSRQVSLRSHLAKRSLP